MHGLSVFHRGLPGRSAGSASIRYRRPLQRSPGSQKTIDRSIEARKDIVQFQGTHSEEGVLMPFGTEGLEGSRGLALSGGGFRATLFHLGTLWRLNELGLLLL